MSVHIKYCEKEIIPQAVLVPMASTDEITPKNISEVNIAVIITIIIGICMAVSIVVFEIQADRYSSVYIVPDSYQHYTGDAQVSFIYGIHSYELSKTTYTVVIHSGNSIIDTKNVTLKPGEVYEEKKIFQLPGGTNFPVKVSVQAISPFDTDEVHFWVRNSTD